MESGDKGAELERRIATYFAGHGYSTSRNVFMQGRSGSQHEIDVLATKEDALTSYRVAIECKAWAQRIEKQTIAKLVMVMEDLGLHKGIVVALGGATSGALAAADARGIEVWGPDEFRRHLGESAIADIHEGRSEQVRSRVTLWAVPAQASPAIAEQRMRASGQRLLGLVTSEALAGMTQLWLPAFTLRLTVARPTGRGRRQRIQSQVMDNLYSALDGSFLQHVTWQWHPIEADGAAVVKPLIRDTAVARSMRKAFQALDRVSTDSAIARHQGSLARLGVPPDVQGVTVEQTNLVHIPWYVGILNSRQGQRAAGVDGVTGALSEPASELLTTHLSHIRPYLGT
jgi:hypothetical protein